METGNNSAEDDAFFENLNEINLKRIFTVRTRDHCSVVDLLTINKRDLFHMRTEFSQIFAELFNGAVPLLQKMVTLRLYAMDQCNQ